MREALARTDHDFVLSGPRRRHAKRLDIFGFLQKPKQAIAFAARHANLTVGIIFAGLLGVVVVNALVWQKSPHPAPLFAHTMPVEPAIEAKSTIESKTVKARIEPVPVPVPEPAPVSTAVTQPAVSPQPAEKAPMMLHGRDPMAEAASLPSQKPATGHDPIAQILKSNTSSQPKAAASQPIDSSRSILAAQRALMKLGYVVKPDGAAGPAFRQALELFERDRNLPIRGTLSPKVIHELSAQSGISVE